MMHEQENIDGNQEEGNALSSIDQLLESTNIAASLDQDLLDKIGSETVDEYLEDLDSRSEWEEKHEQWLKLATQVMEDKTHPWPGASNTKYPLLSTASLQFHARAYPALVNDPKLVKTKIMGKLDEQGLKRSRANRVSDYMSYQLLHEMEDWQDDMDRMLYILPITGLCFKKTYFSQSKQNVVSELVLARDLIINYYAEDFEKARKTHRIWLGKNEVREYQNLDIYLDIDLQDPDIRSHNGVGDEIAGLSQTSDESPHEILESHTWLDLDDDGYKEPYIVTVDHDSQKVLRIVARYSPQGIQQNPEGEILKIVPTEYFTQYSFIPNPESKIYSLGFGSLLGPINSSINTILNQLTDAGTLSNLQGGFLAKGVRVRGGALRYKPGEWKTVQTTGDDLRKGIYPMPTREPSAVLFNLLNMLISSGERLASVKDIMVGENPGQNQPYSTTVAVLEQGMKVFVSIYKRIYRSLGKEYKKVFRLNGVYLDEEKYFNILDTGEAQQTGKKDFNSNDLDIIPGADPSILSEAHASAKANALLEKLMAGLPLNPQMVLQKVLEAEGHENIEELMKVDPPQPDPKDALEQAKFEHQRELDTAEYQLKTATTQYEAMKDYATAIANLAKASATDSGIEIEQINSLIDNIVKQEGVTTSRIQAIASLKSAEDKSQEKKEVSKVEE